MIKTLIIDDEQPIREMLENAIKTFCTDVEVSGTADSVKTALQQISYNTPDLIFLDINLPDGSGFDILEQLPNQTFQIIFITAYDEYAIKAFKFSAVDYLLKPINIDDLKNAIDKCKMQKEKDDLSNKLKILVQNISSNPDEKKIVLKTQESMHIVKVSEIIRCVADHNYTEFYLTNDRKLLVSRTLKEFEEILEEFHFFRSHQSHLVNANYICRFDKIDGGTIIMNNGSRIPVSKRRKDALIELFDKM